MDITNEATGLKQGTVTIATFNSSIIWLEKPLEVTINNFSNAKDSATASTLLTNTYMPLLF